MSRRTVDPEAYAKLVPPALPDDEHWRRIAEILRQALDAAGCKAQVFRACPVCGRIMRLGGLADRRSDGRLSRKYCSNACRFRKWRERRRRAGVSAPEDEAA